MPSTEFLSGLMAIVLLDLVLAGDNAVMIALAARGLPTDLRKQAVLWGSLGAILVRVTLTLIVSWLLVLPGLSLVGGVLLLPIAWKLLRPMPAHADASRGAGAATLRAAVSTIILADTLMGLDNVLAIAGVADGHPLLVLFGLGLSVPLVLWGSTLILKLLDRFPAIVYLGAAMIAFTAARMITHDHLVADRFAAYPLLVHAFELGLVLAVCLSGVLRRHRRGN